MRLQARQQACCPKKEVPLQEFTWPTRTAMPAKSAAAAAPARVPSLLTAPSVPLGTLCRVVMRYVVFPYACPDRGTAVNAHELKLVVLKPKQRTSHTAVNPIWLLDDCASRTRQRPSLCREPYPHTLAIHLSSCLEQSGRMYDFTHAYSERGKK